MSTATSFRHHRPFPFCVPAFSSETAEHATIGPMSLADAMSLYWRVEKVSVSFFITADKAGGGTISVSFDHDFIAESFPKDRVCQNDVGNWAYIREQIFISGCDVGLIWPYNGEFRYPVMALEEDQYLFTFLGQNDVPLGMISNPDAGFVVTFKDHGSDYGGYSKFEESSVYFEQGDTAVPVYLYVDYGLISGVGGWGLSFELSFFDFAA